MSKVNCALALLMLAGSPALGAVATFEPLVDANNVLPGTDVPFRVTVAVESLSGFNWADIIIGIDEANADVSFQYSDQWDAAFANVSPATYDVGFYSQDVFVGGNDPNSVGTSLVLGVATVVTTNLSEGPYQVRIDNSVDGISALGLDTESELLSGSGTFVIVYIPGDMDGSGALNNNDIGPFVLALLNRQAYEAQYPGINADVVGDVDLSGGLNNNDITPFVVLLTSSSGPQAVPEPAALSLLALGGLASIRRRRLK